MLRVAIHSLFAVVIVALVYTTVTPVFARVDATLNSILVASR